MSVVAENVERIIRETGLKKCVVAQRAGFCPKEFSAMLRGRKQILAEHVVPLARALHTSPNDLYGITEEEAPGPEDQETVK